MDFNKSFYVKSLEEDLATQRLVKGVKKPFQTIEQMCSNSKIEPNTVSFGQAARLACTVLSNQYTNTYRPQGIIFQTELQPDLVSPFDLMVLANVPGERIQADYYSIVKELKEHYERALIPGYDVFLFETPEAMMREIPNPEIAWELVNEFREKHGLSPIPEAEKKLVAYNEVIFYQPVPIKPIAVFGDPQLVPNLTERAKDLGLPLYPSAEEFYRETQEQNQETKRSQKIR